MHKKLCIVTGMFLIVSLFIVLGLGGQWRGQAPMAEPNQAQRGVDSSFVIATTSKSGTKLTINVQPCLGAKDPQSCFGAEALTNAPPEVHGPITLYFPTAKQLSYGVVIDDPAGARLYDITVQLTPDPSDYTEADTQIKHAILNGLIVPLPTRVSASSGTIASTSTAFGPYDGHSFRYRGEPINPFCLGNYTWELAHQTGTTTSLVSLPKCYAFRDAENGLDIAHSINASANDIFRNNYSTLSEASDSYIIVGQDGDTFILNIGRMSGIGNDVISDVFEVHKRDDLLVIAPVYVGGDRCDGSVSTVSIDNQSGTLVITQAMTAYNLITSVAQVNDNDNSNLLLDGYAAHAICKGTQTNTFNIKTAARREILSTDIDLPMADDPNDSTYCFDSLLRKRVHQIGARLDADQTGQFVKDFFAQCEPRMNPVFK